jgi:hypothetical protein
LAPSKVPIRIQPFIANFILLVPLASIPAVLHRGMWSIHSTKAIHKIKDSKPVSKMFDPLILTNSASEYLVKTKFKSNEIK